VKRSKNASEARVRGVKACTKHLFNLSHEGILEIMIIFHKKVLVIVSYYCPKFKPGA